MREDVAVTVVVRLGHLGMVSHSLIVALLYCKRRSVAAVQ